MTEPSFANERLDRDGNAPIISRHCMLILELTPRYNGCIASNSPRTTFVHFSASGTGPAHSWEGRDGEVADEAGATTAGAKFEALDLVGADPDAWDDSALVDAYNAALRSYRAKTNGDMTTSRVESEVGAQAQAQAQAWDTSRGKQQAMANAPAALPTKFERLARPAEAEKRAPPAVRVTREERSRRVGERDEEGFAPTLPHPAPRDRPAMRIPPPPPPPVGRLGDNELEMLLLAWYEAGYRAGRYAASHDCAE
jgi:Survival motor neuron protein (SMN)